MIDKKNIENFINYNYKPLSKKECIKRIFCVWGLGLSVCILGKNNIFWFAVIVPVCIIITITIIALIIHHLKSKGARFFCDGVATSFYSIILNIAAYRFYMIFQDEINILLILIHLLILPISITFFLGIVYRSIKLDKYNETATQSSFSAIGALALSGGIGGLLAAKVMLQDAEQNETVIVVSFCLIFLSALLSIGSLNFLRYYLWRKQS